MIRPQPAIWPAHLNRLYRTVGRFGEDLLLIDHQRLGRACLANWWKVVSRNLVFGDTVQDMHACMHARSS